MKQKRNEAIRFESISENERLGIIFLFSFFVYSVFQRRPKCRGARLFGYVSFVNK